MCGVWCEILGMKLGLRNVLPLHRCRRCRRRVTPIPKKPEPFSGDSKSDRVWLVWGWVRVRARFEKESKK